MLLFLNPEKNLSLNKKCFDGILIASFFLFFLVTSLFSEGTIRFKSDYYIFVENPQKPDIYISIFIPYNQLNFVIVDTLFKSEVDISAILYRGGKQKGGEIWRKKIVLNDFDKTNSNKEGILWVFDFSSYPGKYDLHINVMDINSANKGKEIEKIMLPRIEKGSIWVSQPGFMLGKKGEKKGWLVSDDLNVELDSVYIVVEIVTDTLRHDGCLLKYQAINESGDVVLKTNRYIEMDSTIAWEFFHFPIHELEEGDYSILFEITQGGKTVAHNSKTVTVNYPFFLSKRYDLRVEQMEYILSNEYVKKLKESKPEEREKVWNEFWSKKDPIPETPENETSDEYFSRVDYANEEFSSFQAGWRTDRGRTYIIYGKPDEIEYHPFDIESPPYQIWYYFNLGKRFIFVDFSMTGDYTKLHERDYDLIKEW